jgi:excisionase family DNA binding protein
MTYAAIEARSMSLLAPRTVANLLSVSLTTVYRLVERRLIAFVRIGGRLRFLQGDVEAYVTAQRTDTIVSRI